MATCDTAEAYGDVLQHLWLRLQENSGVFSGSALAYWDLCRGLVCVFVRVRVCLERNTSVHRVKAPDQNILCEILSYLLDEEIQITLSSLLERRPRTEQLLSLA